MAFSTQTYIDGALAEGSGHRDVFNPATEDKIATVATAGYDDVDRALRAAKAAFPRWAASPISERQAWIRKLRDEVVANEELLRNCVHYEMGKPWAQTHKDWDRLVVSLEFYAEAMAAGCPIIIRPSEATPVSSCAVGALCAKVGLPRGVVQILCTDGYDVADALTASTIPHVVSLIGTTRTGQHITRTGATSIKRYSTELGGNASVLVFEDADLDLAADVVTGVKFSNAGQIGVSPNRVFVAAAVREAFTEKVVARAKAAKVGFDKHADITTGPVIDKRAWARIKGLVDSAIADGASLLAGGNRPPELNKGHDFAPTVLDGVTETMEVHRQETFGPIVSLVPFADESDLFRMANDCEEGGLTAYIFTRNLARAEQYAAHLRYGEIQINGVKYDIDLPHGGIGQSGIGHDCSNLALYDYLVLKRETRALGSSEFEELNT